MNDKSTNKHSINLAFATGIISFYGCLLTHGHNQTIDLENAIKFLEKNHPNSDDLNRLKLLESQNKLSDSGIMRKYESKEVISTLKKYNIRPHQWNNPMVVTFSIVALTCLGAWQLSELYKSKERN